MNCLFISMFEWTPLGRKVSIPSLAIFLTVKGWMDGNACPLSDQSCELNKHSCLLHTANVLCVEYKDVCLRS